MVVYGEKSSMNSPQKGSVMQKPFSVYNVIVQTLFAPKPEACSDANFDCFGTDNHGRQLTWWRHDMYTFSAQLALCEGNPWSPVGPLAKGQ